MIDNCDLSCFCLVFSFVNYDLLSRLSKFTQCRDYSDNSSFDKKLDELDREDFCCSEIDCHQLPVLFRSRKVFHSDWNPSYESLWMANLARPDEFNCFMAFQS